MQLNLKLAYKSFGFISVFNLCYNKIIQGKRSHGICTLSYLNPLLDLILDLPYRGNSTSKTTSGSSGLALMAITALFLFHLALATDRSDVSISFFQAYSFISENYSLNLTLTTELPFWAPSPTYSWLPTCKHCKDTHIFIFLISQLLWMISASFGALKNIFMPKTPQYLSS